MREFFEQEVSADAAHRERWRQGLDEAAQAEVTSIYADTLSRLEADGATSAPLLRRVLERA